MNDTKVDKVIDYIPSQIVQRDLKKMGHNIDFSAIKLRLIKQKIGGKLYLFGTTLTNAQYKKNLFADLYHKRWDIEELYKITKTLFNIEELHSKTERGVKQEIYAQFVLMNIARFFEMKGVSNKDILSPKKRRNFKGCILGVGKYINELLFKTSLKTLYLVNKIFVFINKMNYRYRTKRRYPRISYKSRKTWGVGRSVILNKQLTE